MIRQAELEDVGEFVIEATCGCLCIEDEKCPHCGCCGRADAVDWYGCCRCPAAAPDGHLSIDAFEAAIERWAAAAAARLQREARS